MSDVVGPVKLEGWSEAIRGLRQVSRKLPGELTGELRTIAKLVQVEAKAIAASKGLAPPGRSGRGHGALIAQLRVFSTTTSAGVRDTAQRKGYSYPRRIEFERGARRAFLAPAGEKTAPTVERRIDEMFSRLRSDAGLGRGGLL